VSLNYDIRSWNEMARRMIRQLAGIVYSCLTLVSIIVSLVSKNITKSGNTTVACFVCMSRDNDLFLQVATGNTTAPSQPTTGEQITWFSCDCAFKQTAYSVLFSYSCWLFVAFATRFQIKQKN